MALVLSLVWTAAWWALAWSRTPALSEYSFFPLWLGYIFSINSISEALYRDSLMRRMGWSFAWLFVLSAPMWWFFEYLNTIVQNWHYLIAPISAFHFFVQASVDFSTVIPAVLSAAFVFERLLGSDARARPRALSSWVAPLMFAVGVFSFVAMPYRPDLLFPLVWIAPWLILGPINYWLGFPSVINYVCSGAWRRIWAIALATLCTGFFWEMWNFWSYPKWTYTVPYVGFLKVFEMPLLGYGGYLFFGLIVWEFSVFVFSILGVKKIVGAISL